MDLYVRAVRHQVSGSFRRYLQSAACFFISVFFGQFGNPFGDLLRIPAGILARLSQQIRIVCVQPQDFLRQLFFCDRFDRKLYALAVFFTVKIYRQLLSRIYHDFPGFSRQGIGSVHPGHTADSVQSLAAVIHRRRYIRSVSPGGHVLLISRNRPQLHLRIRQRFSVINLLCASGPHRQRCRIHNQLAVHRLDSAEMCRYVFPSLIIYPIGTDTVDTPARVGLASRRSHLNGELHRQPVDQHIPRPGQRLSVIQLARALRH